MLTLYKTIKVHLKTPWTKIKQFALSYCYLSPTDADNEQYQLSNLNKSSI